MYLPYADINVSTFTICLVQRFTKPCALPKVVKDKLIPMPSSVQGMQLRPTVAELNVPYALRLPSAALLQHRSFSACTQKESKESRELSGIVQVSCPVTSSIFMYLSRYIVTSPLASSQVNKVHFCLLKEANEQSQKTTITLN